LVYLASCRCGLKLHVAENNDEIMAHWDDTQNLIRHFRDNSECVFKEIGE